MELGETGLPSPSLLRNATSPKGRGFGRPGNFPLDAQGPIWRKRAGLATEGRPVLVQPLRRFAPAPPEGELANEVRLRGCTKTEPSLCRKVRLAASLPVSFCRSLWYTESAALPAHFIREGGESNELYSIFCSVCRSKCNVVLHLQVA